jgi:NCAIR mutase (PurE)-related protein
VAIVGELLEHGTGPVLLTRADDAQRSACLDAHGAAAEASRSMVWRLPETALPARVAVVTAGTSDIPVADEAVLALRAYGFDPAVITDVGVAGLHRLLGRLDAIRRARVVVAVAGMEGALPSVLGGLVDRPVVAVPTSVGYGVGQGGLAALAAMLSSCAAGVTVVNIDNGFGAGYAAALINRGAGAG